MISNPRLLFYSCITKGTIILAEYSSTSEPGIKALALKCMENVPPHHSMISHTVKKRTYAYTLDGLFSYFAILDDVVPKTESLRLFDRMKTATEEACLHSEPNQYCLQAKLEPIFAEIVCGGNKDFEIRSPRGDVDSSKPLLGKPSRTLKKKRMLFMEGTVEKKNELGGGLVSKGLRIGMIHDHHSQKAKQIWRKHVWVVLMFDVCVCVVLFGIWLWVCQGFQCIDG